MSRTFTRDEVNEERRGAYCIVSQSLTITAMIDRRPAFWSAFPYQQALYNVACDEANITGLHDAITFLRIAADMRRMDQEATIVSFLSGLRPANHKGVQMLDAASQRELV